MSINLEEALFVRHLPPTRCLYVDRYHHQSSHCHHQYQQRLVKGTDEQETVLHPESVHNLKSRHILTQTGCSSRHGTHFRAFPASLKSCTTYILYM